MLWFSLIVHSIKLKNENITLHLFLLTSGDTTTPLCTLLQHQLVRFSLMRLIHPCRFIISTLWWTTSDLFCSAFGLKYEPWDTPHDNRNLCGIKSIMIIISSLSWDKAWIIEAINTPACVHSAVCVHSYRLWAVCDPSLLLEWQNLPFKCVFE